MQKIRQVYVKQLLARYQPPPEARFDCVIFNRSLHHLSALQQTMAKVQFLLKQGGRIICQDYAYDRFDEQTAYWLYQMQRLLFLSGRYDADPATLPDEATSIEALRTAWLTHASEHHLNRFEEMMSALHGTYHEYLFAWVPYLFVYIGNGMRQTAPEQERELLTFLKGMEQHLIDHEAINAVAHSPPATSKWNTIEHRLFSFISINWRAHPLTSLEVVLELISHTTTKDGLTVTAVKDPPASRVMENHTEGHPIGIGW